VVAARFAGEHAQEQVDLRLRRDAGGERHVSPRPALPISPIVNPSLAK
jgi:hypothetical protein